MSFCSTCGTEITEDAVFCTNCGATVAENDEQNKKEEQDFLDQTYRLMRWEAKAWSITGKVFIIFGIAYAALMFLAGLGSGIAVGSDSVEGGIAMATTMIVESLVFGFTFGGIGIVSLISANRIPNYFDGFYTDFTPALNRCGSVGMIVFTAFFNEIALVFFLINFIRIKSNRRIIDRILARQKADK